jgi:hypothetical protein
MADREALTIEVLGECLNRNKGEPTFDHFRR